MTVTIKKKVNLTGMQNLINALDQRKKVRVGVLGAKNIRTGDTGPQGITNAEIGLKNEFGDPAERIPARSFIRMPLEHEGKNIEKAVVAKKDAIEQGMLQGNMDLAYTILGIAGEAAISRAFETQGFGQWPANAPMTKAMKGSDKPLIDTGILSQSITSEVVDSD